MFPVLTFYSFHSKTAVVPPTNKCMKCLLSWVTCTIMGGRGGDGVVRGRGVQSGSGGVGRGASSLARSSSSRGSLPSTHLKGTRAAHHHVPGAAAALVHGLLDRLQGWLQGSVVVVQHRHQRTPVQRAA